MSQGGVRATRYAIFGISTIFTAFHLFTASTTPLPALMQRSIHLALACAIVFLSRPIFKGTSIKLLDWLLAAGSFISFGYISLFHYEISLRLGIPTNPDIVLGIIGVIIVLEGTRRVLGAILPTIAVLFLLYARYGYLVPGSFRHNGFDVERIITAMYLNLEGIFGIALAVSATFVAIFIAFGIIFETSGGGQFFIDLAKSLVGHVRGGPAKVSVISSALFGTLSGSIIGNIVTTGSLTIPLMKKCGFSSTFAGAVEAAASTGGMITPPIMGAAAFVMAEIIGIPYWDVVIAALVPAILYYISVFVSVDSYAALNKLKVIPRSEMPSFLKVLYRDWLFLCVLATLIYMLAIVKVSPLKAGIYAVWTTIFISTMKKRTRLSLQQITGLLQKIGDTISTVALPCACCGIIIGVISLTGIGLKLSSILVDLSDGNIFIMLVLSAFACIIFGMAGLVTPAYIMLAIMVAPATVKLGPNIIAVHLFLIHYVSFADITPPVALGAYVAAGIAEGSSFETALQAVRLTAPAFIIPFLFVFNPELILVGEPIQIVFVIITSLFGVTLSAGSLQGYLLGRLFLWQRILMLGGALLLIIPGNRSDIFGLIIVVPAIIKQVIKPTMIPNMFKS